MRKFILTVSRDATAHYTATVEAESLESLKQDMNEHGYQGVPITEWESSFNPFDHVEYYRVEDMKGNTLIDTSEN